MPGDRLAGAQRIEPQPLALDHRRRSGNSREGRRGIPQGGQLAASRRGQGRADETGNATAIYKRVERGEKILDSAYALAEKFDRLPAIVVPLMRGRTDGMDVFNQSGMWGSIYPAIWSFCLAARERGLGTAWTTASCMREREVCEVLDIPIEKFTHIGLLPVAYYEGDSFSKAWRKPLDEVLTWNSFEG